MKKTKILSLLLAVIMLAGSAPLNESGFSLLAGLAKGQKANAASDEALLGDVDNNGSITAADARYALRAAVGLDDSGLRLRLELADVDGKKGVSAADARLILRAAVGLERLYSGNVLRIGSDRVFIPEESAIVFDEKERIIYYNNFINVYLFSALNNAQEDSLAALVGGTVAGELNGAVNMLQINVPETTLADLQKKCDRLMKEKSVFFATYDVPNDISEMQADSDPWSDTATPIFNRNNEASPDGNDWWAEAIHAYSAWEKTDNLDTHIDVGVIDSGFYNNHPDLKGKINFYSEYINNTPDNHGTHVAGLIAANNNTIGMRGVSKYADLYCIDYNFLSRSDDIREELEAAFNDTPTASLLAALKFLIEKGVKVINQSFGKTILAENYFNYLSKQAETDDNRKSKQIVEKYKNYDAYFQTMQNESNTMTIQYITLLTLLLAQNKEVYDFLIVQAAGNGRLGYYVDRGDKSNIRYDVNIGVDVAEAYGGSLVYIDKLFNSLPSKERLSDDYGISLKSIKDHILVVGGVNKPTEDSNNTYDRMIMSNYGNCVDIFAPGGNVYSTVYNESTGDYSYSSQDGTSMAAPIVSGSAALIWGLDPALKASEVKDILLSTANTNVQGIRMKDYGIDGFGNDKNSRYKMVNLDAAVDKVLNENYYNLWSAANKVYCDWVFFPDKAGIVDKNQKIDTGYADFYRMTDKNTMSDLNHYFTESIRNQILDGYVEMNGGTYKMVGGIGDDMSQVESVRLINKNGNHATIQITGHGYDIGGYGEFTINQSMVYENNRWLFSGDYFVCDY